MTESRRAKPPVKVKIWEGPTTPLRVSEPAAAPESETLNGGRSPDKAPEPGLKFGIFPFSTVARSRVAKAATVFTILGLLIAMFLLYQFVGSNLLHARHQKLLASSFKDSLGRPAPKATALPPVGDPIGILSIEAIDLEAVIVEGTGPKELERGPGHFRGTSRPGGEGNMVIAGRRTSFGAPFRRLEELGEGDTITVSSRFGRFNYIVSRSQTVALGDPDVVTQTGDNRLTLVTSNPPYLATGRLALTAFLDQDPILGGAPSGPVLITGEETGLAGDTHALAPLLILAQALIVLIVLAAMAFRHRPGRAVYLLVTPVLLLMLLAIFSQLSRLLPGTL